MHCSLLLAATLASASTPCSKDCQASNGVVLLQRPSAQVTHVNIDKLDIGRNPLFRHVTFAEEITTSLTELQPMLKQGERETYNVLLSGEWSRWTPHKYRHKTHSMHTFLTSVVMFDWCLFGAAIMVFFLLHMFVLGRMAENGWHLLCVMIWIVVGGVYNAVIWARFGSDAGISWFAGYLLEYIFLIENIFIFHIVIAAFKTPINLTTKALHIVVWAQIMFEMIFFMGLAAWLRSFKVLPYILGTWLICCGFLAACGEPSMQIEIMETAPCKAFTSCLGDRLSPSYEKHGECLLRDSSGRMQVSLLGLVVFVLLLADFLLEIDVVLTKIEELPNHYIAFTSSAVAAFSIPDLFFVSKDLLKRFKMLKYGIGFVLVLFGTQMLLSSVYVLRPIVACCIIVGVLCAGIVLSVIQSLCHNCGPNRGHAGAALAGAERNNPQDAAAAQEAEDPQEVK